MTLHNKLATLVELCTILSWRRTPTSCLHRGLLGVHWFVHRTKMGAIYKRFDLQGSESFSSPAIQFEFLFTLFFFLNVPNRTEQDFQLPVICLQQAHYWLQSWAIIPCQPLLNEKHPCQTDDIPLMVFIRLWWFFFILWIMEICQATDSDPSLWNNMFPIHHTSSWCCPINQVLVINEAHWHFCIHVHVCSRNTCKTILSHSSPALDDRHGET